LGQASEGDLKTHCDSHNSVVCDITDALRDNAIIKLSAVNPANAYHVVGETPNQASIKFMIDTSAVISLICKDVWTKITEGNVELSLWEGCQFVGAK